MSVLDVLQQQLGEATIRQISKQVGADQGAVSKAVSAGLPLLVSALASNSSQSSGASALLGALDRDHDGSILDDDVGFLGQSGSSRGESILKHVLGGKQLGGASNAIGKASGLDAKTVVKVLGMLAPVVMGAIGRTRRERNLDADGLSSLLSEERRQIENAEPKAMSLMSQFLDSDGDGQIADDLARVGVGMLGKLFSGQR